MKLKSFTLSQPVKFNGSNHVTISYTSSAEKHYGESAEAVFRSIVPSWNGQNRFPDTVGKYGPEYHVASSITGTDFQSGGLYRDTRFTCDSENQTITIFHASGRRPKQFEKYPEKMKIRIE